MAFSIKLKTEIGQHNFEQKFCSKYCKMDKRFCPFSSKQVKQQISSFTNGLKITRWTDIQKSTTYDVGSLIGGITAGELTDEEKAQFSVINYTCWGDGSGFQYDQMSDNIIGPGGGNEGIYDITSYGVKHVPLKFSDWNAWIQKFQYDYRFGRVSDTNATTLLFPNVDNPWMFTEYVFKGIGNVSDGAFTFPSVPTSLKIPTQYVIQPPVYSTKDFSLINGDTTKEQIGASIYKSKYKGLKENETDTDPANTKVRSFRQLCNWSELLKSSSSSPRYTELNYQDNGLKLYRAKIPVQCIKWGQHGNIPPHTLDMTSPPQYLDPGQTVTRIKAVTMAYVGSPFYACSADGQTLTRGVLTWGEWGDTDAIENQAYIDNVSSGRAEWMRLGSTEDDANADNIKEIAIKTYEISFSLGEPLGTPRNTKQSQNMATYPKLKPNKIIGGVGQNNYCHNGCALLYGRGGKRDSNQPCVLKCSYLQGLHIGSPDLAIMNDYFVLQKCLNHGSYGGSSNPCPHYVPSDKFPIIATYEVSYTTYKSFNLY